MALRPKWNMRLGVEYDKRLNHDDDVNNVFTYFSEDCTSNFNAIEQSVIEGSNSQKNISALR